MKAGIIPMIICKLFGHKIWTDVWSGKTINITNKLTGNFDIVPVNRPKRNQVCPRCDERIPDPK